MKAGWIAALTLLAACAASAQEYPSKPVRLVVPYPAGSSSNDIIARVLAEKLSAVLPQRVIVENRPGAGGAVGSECGIL